MTPAKLNNNILFKNHFVTIFKDRNFPASPSIITTVRKNHHRHGIAVIPLSKDGLITLLEFSNSDDSTVQYALPTSEIVEKDLDRSAENILRKEVGKTTGKLKYIQRLIENPSTANFCTHVFLATNTKNNKESEKFNKTKRDKIKNFTIKEVKNLCEKGLITDSITLLSLNVYFKNI